MKKLWIGMAVALTALIVCGCAMAETMGTCGDGLNWSHTDDGVLTISGTGSMPDYTGATAPWGTAMERVVIEEGVTSIGAEAFLHCRSLTGITIPDSVTGIGALAFCECRALKSITIPDSVAVIGEAAFAKCSGLTAVNIPAGVTRIESQTFDGCESIISVDIPDSVTRISNDAFHGCSILTGVAIPDSVTDAEGAFGACSNLREICVSDTHSTLAIKDGVLFSKDGSVLVQFPAGSTITAYTVPEGVTRIASGAFSGCKRLTGIIIPDTVQKIDNGAFSGCSSLTDIVIPDSVTAIDFSAFSDCGSLTNVSVPKALSGKLDSSVFDG